MTNTESSQPGQAPRLPNREMLRHFTALLFKHADRKNGFFAFRIFLEDRSLDDDVAVALSPPLGNMKLINAIVAGARTAANHSPAAVFCPPACCTFRDASN